MKEINKEVISLQNDDPHKWGELSIILVKEYESESFKQALAECLCSVVPKFKQKRENNDPFPYHYAELIEREDFYFHYFVQVIAPNDSTIDNPLPIICGVLHFPQIFTKKGEPSYYVFHILGKDPRISKFEIDVFAPHFFNRYARRSPKMEEDLDMPNTFHSKKNKETELHNLFLFVGKFFARNKINRLISKKEAYSEEEQESKENKNRKEWPVALWADGLTYCKTFETDNLVNLHLTYLPYTGNPACLPNKEEPIIYENQTEAIASDFALFVKEAQMYFPEQYNDFVLFEKMAEMPIKNAFTICQKCDKLFQLCRNFIIDVSAGILTNEEKVQLNEKYKEPQKYSIEDIDKAKKIVSEHKHFTTSNTENVKEVFYAFLCVNTCLCWHIKMCFELHKKISSMDSDKSILFRMQIMSVITEMLELSQLLYDFFPEPKLKNNIKLS